MINFIRRKKIVIIHIMAIIALITVLISFKAMLLICCALVFIAAIISILIALKAILKVSEGGFTNKKVNIVKKGLKAHEIVNNELHIGTISSVIREKEFERNNGIRKVVVPSEVSVIENNAFENCEDLEEVVIKKGVVFIGKEAFAECKNLITVEIPSSVVSIGKDIFCSDISKKNFMGENYVETFNICTIYGEKDSYAQEYAIRNNIKFVEV